MVAAEGSWSCDFPAQAAKRRRFARFCSDPNLACSHTHVQIEQSGKPVDLMHYHHAWDGFYEGRWADAKAAYKKILRDPSVVKLVTVMREPVSHYMSYYYYFLQPETGVRRNEE